MSAPKLCTNCKHIVPIYPRHPGFLDDAICGHPEAPVNLIDGRKDGACRLMRSTNCLVPHCGTEGNWFEKAPPPAAAEPFMAKSYAGTYGGTVEGPRVFTLSERFARWVWGAKD